MKKFPHPVGVLLFNRPEYAERTLKSLTSQTSRVNHRATVIVIDGYPGSRDERREFDDRTNETFAVAKAYLPDATILRHTENQGIAACHATIERHLFERSDASWGVIFEEDFILSPTYLETMTGLILHCTPLPQIGVVSLTGDTLAESRMGPSTLHPMDHLWAFALKRRTYQTWSPVMTRYLEITQGAPYYLRSESELYAFAASVGLIPIGTSQDHFKRATLRLHGILALTTEARHGRYIGETGEHSTAELFAASGFSRKREYTGEVLAEFEVLSELDRIQTEGAIATAQEFLEFVRQPLTACQDLTRALSLKLTHVEQELSQASALEVQRAAEASLYREEVAALHALLETTTASAARDREALERVLRSRSWRLTEILRRARLALRTGAR